MKLKVKVLLLREGINLPSIIKKGDWIDLEAAASCKIKSMFSRTENKSARVNDLIYYIPLGVAMELPKGFEAIVVSRSSTPKNYGIMCPNSFGVIDNTYCSCDDEWKYPAIGLKNTSICPGDRICQFRIQLSQKATFLQKLKWFLSSGIRIQKVKKLKGKKRGGFGSTGK